MGFLSKKELPTTWDDIKTAIIDINGDFKYVTIEIENVRTGQQIIIIRGKKL